MITVLINARHVFRNVTRPVIANALCATFGAPAINSQMPMLKRPDMKR